MSSFAELGIRPEIIAALTDLGFTAPTPIQEQIIPVILKNPRDIVGLAQTGTGKTAAFGIPTVQLCLADNRATQALILCPTRELCMQVARDLNAFAGHLPGLMVCAVYGGAGIEGQIRALRRGAQVIVATPGRLNDLLRRREVDLAGLSLLVLDEADEMLQMGFQDELNAILAQTPAGKNTLLFSATMAGSVAAIAKSYMKNPLEITVGDRNAGAENIRHLYYLAHARDRYQALRRIVDMSPGMYAIIFCRTRQEAGEIAEKLGKDGHAAEALHGELSQSQRDQVMQRFRERTVRLLVATDVAARGLDVSDLTHVINYNLPDDLANYTHRSGRTGRAGRAGISISIIHLREKFRIKEMEQRLKKRFEPARIPSGREICETRLLHGIEAVKSTAVNEERLAPFRESIAKALTGLDREELILRFIARELDGLLAHYQDAPDLNVQERVRGREEEGGRRESRFSRPAERISFSRFQLNIGQSDGLYPARLIGQINDASGGAIIKIGRIEIQEKTASFEADSRFARQVAEVFSGLTVNGRRVEIKTIEGRQGKVGTGGYQGRGGRGGKPFAGKSRTRPEKPGFARKEKKKPFSG